MSTDNTRGDQLWETIPKLVRSSAEAFGDNVAVADTDRNITYTYQQLWAESQKAAEAFIASGLEVNDRAAIWAPNMAEWIVAAVGLQAAGGVLVPLNTRFKGKEAGYVLGRSGARFLFSTVSFMDTDYPELLASASGGKGPNRPVAELENLAEIIILDASFDRVVDASAPGYTTWQSFMQRGQNIRDPASQDST